MPGILYKEQVFQMDAGSKKLLSRLKEEIDAFAGEVPQFDDITMLCFHYIGKE